MKVVAVVAALVASGCQESPHVPRTACERYVDVRMRCQMHVPPDHEGSAAEYQAGYRSGVEKLCREALDTGAGHTAFDEIRCAERSLECGDFYDCSADEAWISFQMQQAEKALAAAKVDGPRKHCHGLREISKDLAASDRPSASPIVIEIVHACGRDAWLESARRGVAAFDQLVAEAEARRAQGERVPVPDFSSCHLARLDLDEIDPADRDHTEVKELIAQVDARCSDAAVAALIERWLQ